ncbi:mitochondrial distribution and morphology protein family 31/32 [Conidiobolus coronatus NRRL 28638]|uniref:Mitochondrial distribution and morphology protein family 31/32 n=1 Tax=Conidiobolus coronatus (strain ATCC 28846 / CBS 209.66 / NRRL 28638) TaxID=796925 RepID=A0A137P8Q4_CONC2|nr:mitochondrial distribution and morphology protein family 31/32 [Conidiobolus coronatus NRRL 28638]|eukprot:KXN71359.1 mitochondrial distribution and morphology protein family 31/32 [Conidiobolus coronatus NRRL 28638]
MLPAPEVHLSLFGRMRAAVKRLLFRYDRPWTLDDIMAIFSWIFLSQTMFILAGTTTFVSLLLALGNSLQFQDFIKARLGSILSQQIGMNVSFESAILPNWKGGKITLNKVRVQYNVENLPDLKPSPTATVWNLEIDKIDITLSLMRWLDNKGLVQDFDMSGVRGTIDRSRVEYPEDYQWSAEEFRNKRKGPGLEFESVHVKDLMITLLQPYGFRPYKVSIFNAQTNQLRTRWLFYDMISANSIVGMFDNCLFSIHRAQGFNDSCSTDLSHQHETSFKRSQIRMDGVPIDHLNNGVSGPFGWIKSGSVDFCFDLSIPLQCDSNPLKQLASDLFNKLDELLITQIPPDSDSAMSNIVSKVLKELPRPPEIDILKQGLQSVTIDASLRFRDIKSEVPLINDDITYTSQAVVRPVIAFMNAHKTSIPIHTKFKVDLDKFDGSWTQYDAELDATLSNKVGEEMMNLVYDEQERNRRLKRVGLWGLQNATRNIIMLIEYARGVRGFWHYLGVTPDHHYV